jgi:hypothetical protein
VDDAADIDLLFTSGNTLVTPDGMDAPVPCDFWDQDNTIEGEEGFGGAMLNRKTVLVRTSALPVIGAGHPVIITDADDVQTRFVLAEPPMRIQDGKVSQLTLQVENVG